MSRDIQKAYARGYTSGLRRNNPAHRLLPLLADCDALPLLKAAQGLREQVDVLLATFADGDFPELEAAVDAWDDAVKAMNAKRIAEILTEAEKPE